MRKSMIILAILLAVFLFFYLRMQNGKVAFAGGSDVVCPDNSIKPPDVVELDRGGRMGLILFNHKNHENRADCAVCHHKDKRCEEQKCGACHKTKIERKEAFHGRCKGCHKKNNGPTRCGDCHKR